MMKYLHHKVTVFHYPVSAKQAVSGCFALSMRDCPAFSVGDCFDRYGQSFLSVGALRFTAAKAVGISAGALVLSAKHVKECADMVSAALIYLKAVIA